MERGTIRAALFLVFFAVLAHAGAQSPTVETFTVGTGLPSSEVYDLAQDCSGRLWIVHRTGISIYDGRTFTAHPLPDRGPDSSLRMLEVDESGRVWAVTWSSRAGPLVSWWQGSAWHHLPRAPLVPDPLDDVTALILGTKAPTVVVVGTWHQGLLIWDGEAWTRINAMKGALPSAAVNDLKRWGGDIFVGTGAGLCVLDRQFRSCSAYGEDPRLREEIFALETVAGGTSGTRLRILGATWIGDLDPDGLRLKADDLKIPEPFSPLRGAMVSDSVGGVWFGNPNGVFFLDPAGHGVRRMSRRQGLAADGALELFLDRESNVWIGGLRGLSRIGSQRFLSLGREQGLLEDEVTALLEPAPGIVLLGHNNGLTLMKDERFETLIFETASFAPRNASRVLDMAVDAYGRVWLAANEAGLLRLSASATRRLRPEHLRRVDLPGAERVFSVEIDARGRIWATDTKMLFVSDDGERFSRVETGLSRDDFHFYRWLTAASGDRLYVAAVGGVLWNQGEAWRLASGPTQESENVYDVFPTPSGRVWVGTKGGLYELDHERRELVEVSEGALSIRRPIYSIFADARGRLWFGTDDGVFVGDRRELRHLSVRQGLAGRDTNRGATLTDHRGRIWIGTDLGASIYQEPYDRKPVVAPIVRPGELEAEGRRWPHGRDVRLRSGRSPLTFHVETITFRREDDVLYRYRLEGSQEPWQGPVALGSGEIRYTNVPPGRYRFRVAAGWEEGPWSEEAVTAWIVIPRPWWRRRSVYAAAAVALGLAVAAAHRVRTRTIRARNQELEAVNARLNESVRERRRLIAELEARNFELEQFTYTVSHDLKTPLFTVQGFFGLLERDAASGNAERMVHDVREIRNAADKMARLLNELLELSRVGRVVNAVETVSMDDIVHDAVDSTSGLVEQRGVAVEIEPSLGEVVGDRVRLVEVVQNLLENAVKYMGDQNDPRIVVGRRRQGDGDVFYVGDNGIGIEERYFEKIFSLFERLDPATEGTGVGLTLARRIVEFHGGRIWVESEGPGRGSTFCFTVPRP